MSGVSHRMKRQRGDVNVQDIPMVITQEIRDALRDNGPVVALESTIISHGMPYPQNAETARSVEWTVRASGAIPATIAILDGVMHVGLTDESLEVLAKAGKSVRKCSRRDIAISIARKEHGATTVAATMIIAKLAGIKVFVTGGIGGVHRGAETSMDISADLIELGRTDVAVVCAGVKSILDIGKTLEVLETQGVTVVGYRTPEFPAFFTTASGFAAPNRMDSPQEVADLIRANHAMHLESGMLIAVPVPKDQEAENQTVQAAIEQALKEAEDQQVLGFETTPFLLRRVNEISKGESLRSNIALILNNARAGAEIAVALSDSLRSV